MSIQQRAPWHDYRSRCIYMVTLKKGEGVQAFGRLEGCCGLPVGQKGSPHVVASAMGNAVKEVLWRIADVEPAVQLLQYALMPDHVHLLIQVRERTADRLGRIIARFKVAVNEAAGCQVFERGFNDQILKPSRNLDRLYAYLRENPYRLAVRRGHPEFFTRINSITIDGVNCQAYGNMHLLSNPFKEALAVHRRYTANELQAFTDSWLYTAANGGVIVSPFISPAERALRTQIEDLGGKIILITDQSFPERYKPAAHDFALCTEGRLLIISIKNPVKTLTRATCLRMNALAEALAKGDINPR